MASRFKEFVKKYGKVAIGVHFGVSGVSISGFYIAIKNNVDVESLLEKYQIPGFSNKDKDKDKLLLLLDDDEQQQQQQQQLVLGSSENKTKQLAKSAGGALALAVLCNKALFPIRVPITMALTPPIARFLRHRNIPKSGA